MGDVDKYARDYYLKGREPADEVVRQHLRGRASKLIVHGGRATNAFLPTYLDKPTFDWDIFTTGDPEQAAKQLEAALDERYGGNYFEVRPAKHRGTFSVVSIVTKTAIADITIPERRVPSRRLNGINYATLDHHVRQIQRTLKDPDSKYRWKQDRETLQRIRLHQADTAEEVAIRHYAYGDESLD